MGSIRSDQKEGAEWAVGYAIFGLKNKILCEVDKEIAVLETKWQVKMNEPYQTTATRLQNSKIWWQ